MTEEGYATPHIEALAKRPNIEKAARALATNDRGHDDDYWLYNEEVEIALRESGALDIIRDLLICAGFRPPGPMTPGKNYRGTHSRATAFLAEAESR